MGIINYTKKSLRLHGLGDFSLGEFFYSPFLHVTARSMIFQML